MCAPCARLSVPARLVLSCRCARLSVSWGCGAFFFAHYKFGGSGSDTFLFASGDGFVNVRDFEDDVDIIDLSSYGYSTVVDALADMTQVGNHIRFADSGDIMLILNTDLTVIADDIDIGAAGL